MTKEKINEYTVRISQSSGCQLVAISCEIAVDYMSDAEKALEKNDKKSFSFYIKKAMDFVDDLSSSLDMKYPVASQLLSLYMYVKRTLIHANAAYTDENIESCKNVMGSIGRAYENIAMQDENAEKIMENSEQIYAGYTYGRDSRLNEYVVRN
jgi:flagellar protein FliS